MHTFHVDGLEHSLRVVRFTGDESISQPFQLEITVVCDEHNLAPGHVVGRPATLGIHVDGETRLVHGIVSRFARGSVGNTRAEYRVTVVPAMWRLRLRTDSRIFQGLTVPEILADVLARSGFQRADDRAWERRDEAAVTGYQLVLGATYLARENCVQYRESDWDFINRLMEEEGIHYFFEHNESSHVLVVSDAPTAHEPLRGGDAISFRPSAGAMSAGEHVARFHFAEEVRPARVVLSDYSFERPMLPLGAAAQADGNLALEVFEHPGDYDLPATGNSLSQIRLEELQASRWTGEGDSNSPRLAPGTTFWLTDHPCADLNQAYLITRVEHRGAEAYGESDGAVERYGCRFEVIPANVAFRAPRRTPRPVIHGIQTAIVVGPPGEEIHTDEHGRVKVRFHWDRSGRNDDRCSCWMRVAQASAGAAWGSLFLPRVGHEVVVDFIEGDPDRPLVTGSVYHGTNVPPYPLPAEKTKSTIKTNSSGGGGGSNELRFEDRKGSEEVYLHSQRNLAVAVENDKDQKVGGDETLHVSGNRTVTVNECHTETVLLAQTILVGAAQTVTVGGLMALTVGAAKTEIVGAASIEAVAGMKSTSVGFSYSAKAGTNVRIRSGKNTSLLAGGNMSEEAGKDLSLTAGKDLSATAAGAVAIDAGKGMTVDVTGDHEEKATEKRTLIIGEKLSIQCGTSVITIDKTGKITIQGKDITVMSAGAIKIDGKKVHVTSGGAVTVDTTGKVKIKGGIVGIN